MHSVCVSLRPNPASNRQPFMKTNHSCWFCSYIWWLASINYRFVTAQLSLACSFPRTYIMPLKTICQKRTNAIYVYTIKTSNFWTKLIGCITLNHDDLTRISAMMGGWKPLIKQKLHATIPNAVYCKLQSMWLIEEFPFRLSHGKIFSFPFFF